MPETNKSAILSDRQLPQRDLSLTLQTLQTPQDLIKTLESINDENYKEVDKELVEIMNITRTATRKIAALNHNAAARATLINSGADITNALSLAAQENNLLVLKSSIEAAEKINDAKFARELDLAKAAALTEAVRHNHMECAQYLMNSGAKITDTLSWVVKEENTSALQALIDAGSKAIGKSAIIAIVEELINNNNNAAKEVLSSLTNRRVRAEEILIHFSSLAESMKDIADVKTAALRVSAQQNDIESCVGLINLEANIAEVLLWAAQKNNLPALKSLIEAAEKINDEKFARELDLAKTAALTEAVRHNHVECAQYLMNSGAKITDTLLWAARENNVSALEILVNAGADINTVSKSGITALIEGLIYNNDAAIKYLVDNGADVIQALMWAAKPNNNSTTDILGALTQAGVNTKDILLYLVENTNLSTLAEVIKAIADDKTQETADAKTAALRVSAQQNNAEACAMLINSGADITNALSLAAQENNLLVLKSSIEAAEKINDEKFARELDLAKTAALTEAVRHNHVECAQYLMNSGAKITDTLLWAARENNVSALEILVNAGAEANKPAGQNALQVAAQNNNAEACVMLINSGANLTEALSLAAQENNLPALKSFIEAAKKINDEKFVKKLELAKTAALDKAVYFDSAEAVEYLITQIEQPIAQKSTNAPISSLVNEEQTITTSGNSIVRTHTPITIDHQSSVIQTPWGNLINIESLLILAAKHNSYKAIEILDKYISDAANVVAGVCSCYNDQSSIYSNSLQNIERLTVVAEVSSKAKSDALIVAAYCGNYNAVQALIKDGSGIEKTVKIDEENLSQTVNNIITLLPSGVVQPGSSVSTENHAEGETNEQHATSANRPDNSPMIALLRHLQKIQAEIGKVKNKKDLSKLMGCDSRNSNESDLIERFVRELVFRSNVKLDSKVEKLIVNHIDKFGRTLFPTAFHGRKLHPATELISFETLMKALSLPPEKTLNNKKHNTKFYHKLLAILKSWQTKGVSTGSWRVKDIERLEQHVNDLAAKPKETKLKVLLETITLVRPRSLTTSGNKSVSTPIIRPRSLTTSGNRNVSTPITQLVIPFDKKVPSNPVSVKERTHSEQSGHNSNLSISNSGNTQRTSKVHTRIKTNGSLGYGTSSPSSTPPEYDNSSVSSALAHSTETAHTNTKIAINHGVQQ